MRRDKSQSDEYGELSGTMVSSCFQLPVGISCPLSLKLEEVPPALTGLGYRISGRGPLQIQTRLGGGGDIDYFHLGQLQGVNYRGGPDISYSQYCVSRSI